MATRHYKLVLNTVGPVHIGNGNDYTGKDYFKLDDRSVGVLDARRFAAGLSDQEREEYTEFLIGTGSASSLEDFLRVRPRLLQLARECLLYSSDMRLSKARRGSTQYYQVKQCIKDAYGCPYVPGSSVKGMLRTALLAYRILADPERYARLYDSAAVRNGGKKDPDSRIEREAFWNERYDTRDGQMEVDIMRYVSVSDSAPLSAKDLVFAKKFDKFAKADDARHKLAMGKISRRQEFQEGNELNIYRECIRPGTSIELTLDVDERIDAYLDGLSLDGEGIASVLERSFDLYKRCFLDEFDLSGVEGASKGSADDGRCRYVGASGLRCRNKSVGGTGYCNTHKDAAASAGRQVSCSLGGGVDFDSKTVINALFADDGVRLHEMSHILYDQFPTKLSSAAPRGLDREVREAGFIPQTMPQRGKAKKNDHRHWKDELLGVSPHTVKLGIVGGKKYVMGRCSLSIEEAL